MPKFDKYNDNVDIHLSSEQPSFLTKFTLDLKTKKATQKRLLNLVVERPSYNTGVVARTIAYLRSEGDSSRVMGTEIIKYDLKNEKILGSYKCQKECVFGEAFFVSSSGILCQNSIIITIQILTFLNLLSFDVVATRNGILQFFRQLNCSSNIVSVL